MGVWPSEWTTSAPPNLDTLAASPTVQVAQEGKPKGAKSVKSKKRRNRSETTQSGAPVGYNTEALYEGVKKAMSSKDNFAMPELSPEQQKLLLSMIRPLINRYTVEQYPDLLRTNTKQKDIHACLASRLNPSVTRKGSLKAKALSSGAFGTVYKVASNLLKLKVSVPGEFVAVKVETVDNKEWAKRYPFSSSFDVLVKATKIAIRAGQLGVGPKVFDFYPCMYGKTPLFITIMEFSQGIPWADWQDNKTSIQTNKALSMLKHKFAVLTKHRILHSDIHSENVLVEQDDKGNASNLTVIDYGLAKTVSEAAQYDLDDLNPYGLIFHVLGYLLKTGVIQL